MGEQVSGGELSGELGTAGGREQWFHFGPWVFDVAKAQQIVAEAPREPLSLPVEQWARFFGLAEREPGRFSFFGPRKLDQAYAMTADLDKPVLVATLRSESGGDFQLFIDGTHRLYRAYVEQVAVLPAHVLSVEETLAVRGDGVIGQAYAAPTEPTA